MQKPVAMMTRWRDRPWNRLRKNDYESVESKGRKPRIYRTRVNPGLPNEESPRDASESMDGAMHVFVAGI
jgi:hypothetical protein